MNVILTYNQTSEFNEVSKSEINKIQFSQIPEMKVLVHELEVNGEMVLQSTTIPYQANATVEQFDRLKATLEQFGVVYIIGKWNDDGSKIELDNTKYKNALKDIEVFEDVDIYSKDENGDDVLPVLRSFKRVKELKRPTLSQSKLTQVNVFNNKFKRQLC